MRDNQYAYAVARIRVKEKNLLTDADVARMAGMRDADEVLAFLKERGWGSGAEEDAGGLFSFEEKRALDTVRELGIGEETIEVLSYPQMYHNLKTAIKAVITGNERPEAFYGGIAPGLEEVRGAMTAGSYGELPEHMQEAAREAAAVMMRTRDGQLCDTICDRACLEALEAAAGKTGNAAFSKYLKRLVASADINIAVRGSRTGKSAEFLKRALAPSGLVDTAALKDAASRGSEELFAWLSKAGFTDAAEAAEKSPSAFECWRDGYVLDAVASEKTNPFSEGPVTAYYIARLNEIRMARIVVTAKANGFTEGQIASRVRKMYA